MRTAKQHLKDSVPLVEEQIATLKKEIADLIPEVDIVTIGELVKKQIDLIHLEDKLVNMLKELGE